MASRIVIAGAGLAGLRAAQAARAAGHEGEIVLVGDEPHAPYTRPPLSKQLLAGEQTAADCTFPGLDTLQAELRLGAPVVGIDPAVHAVTLDGGEALDYARLIVATGCRARPLPTAAVARASRPDGTALSPGVPSVRDPGVHTLRDLDDAHRLAAALSSTTHLAIVGAGFLGCEVAATARARGLEVTLIDIAAQPLPPLGPVLGARIAQLHREHGVALRLGVGVAGTTSEHGRLTGVALTDGTTVEADHLLVAVGALPNTEFLADSAIELALDGGIVCDATLTSVSDPDVLAAGDVAAWPHPGAGGERVRVEHWTTAAEHGRLAGANAVREPGERIAHVAPPYFWSDQYDLKLQSVGFPARAARIEIVDTEASRGRLAAEALDDNGRLVGAVTFNHARRLADYRRRLAADTVAA
jgi:3-phenylpropionate/trans-cinnamate dioxygenase ferredoxin reductase subunit